MAAQLDIVSGGRLVLGLGAGWQENEHQAYGIPYYTMRERLARLDEACQVLKALWTQRRTDFKGALLPALGRAARPQARAEAASRADDRRGRRARHAAHRRAAREPLEHLGRARKLAHKGAILDQHCAAVGRDPKSIRRSVNMPLLITDREDEIAKLAEFLGNRLRGHVMDPRDTVLAGTPDQIRAKLRS